MPSVSAGTGTASAPGAPGTAGPMARVPAQSSATGLSSSGVVVPCEVSLNCPHPGQSMSEWSQ